MNKVILCLACASLLLQACSKSAPTPEPVRAVKVLTVGAHTYGSYYEYAGEIRARVESNLGFRVGGKVVSRQVTLGQSVKAGQVLAQLDAQDLKLSFDAARSQAAAALTQRD